MSGQKFIRPSKAFAALGLCTNTGYRLIKAGVLPTVKVGGTLLIPVAAIELYHKK